MKKSFPFLMMLLLMITVSCSETKQETTTELNIIPKPLSLIVKNGSFEINKETKVIFDAQNNFQNIASVLNEKLLKAANFEMQIETGKAAKNNSIFLELGNCPDSLGSEGYVLKIEKNGIEINANAANGLFYAMQTIRQMLPAEIESETFIDNKKWILPYVEITDKPQYVWRGMLLDCCRNFMEKDFVLRYIDLLAYHKMNRFHWHLTEDQGWRIEIKQFPELTNIGAWRTEKDGSRYGGFYTQAEIREVVAYAKSRFIEVIPEIELPGHSLAALASYPELSCTGGPFEVGNKWGVFKDVYCAGNEQSFEFLEKVYDEIFELFPFEYVHIGGDESPKYRWENCEKCQKRIKQEGLKDEHELQSYFITRMEKYINANGRKIIGWDEILEGGLAPSATVQSWRGFDGAKAAAQQGHDAIVSPTSHAYFDYSIETTDLQKVYSFNLIPDGLEKKYRKHILGGECNMWTERAKQNEIDNRMFPRILAMSEVLWTAPEKKDYVDFYSRVQNHYEKLDFLNVKYGFETKAISVVSSFDTIKNSYVVDLIAGQKGYGIFYTTDGSEPTINSSKYANRISINKTCVLKAIAIKDDSKFSKVIQQKFIFHKATGLKIELKNKYSPSYSGSHSNALVDGLCGTLNFRDGKWQGFQENNLVAVINFEEQTQMSKVSISCLQSMPSWIFMPKKITVYVSDNGAEFSEITSITPDINQKRDDIFILNFDLEFAAVSKQYIKIVAENVNTNPAWHDAAGAKSWLFVDEIVVE